eukprot:TRINITY_DN6317_c0_g3_i1.p1 TRINITY_DN6317_c0_g3~~TRINITY_DN6317_c0_g3_i1.p1  ORF type:complete len:245 (+),score=54.21 TRINITY_DN6317_c0_g3_i1:55-789(+)
MYRAAAVLCLVAAAGAGKLPGRCSDLVIGSHHKTGTVLAKHIFHTICGSEVQYLNRSHSEPCDRDRPCLYDHFGPAQAATLDNAPFVHFIRDPLDWLVSGYQYHLFTTEAWATETGYQQRLKKMTEEEGLSAEVQRAMREITEAAIVYNMTRYRPDTITVRLEEVGGDYDTFTRVFVEIQKWLGVGVVDVSKHFKGGDKGQKEQTGPKHAHVTSKADKPRLKSILMKHHGSVVCHLRHLLGKPC